MDDGLAKSPRSHPVIESFGLIFDDDDEAAGTMGKRKRRFEGNERQSACCKIMLKCGHPYSSKQIDFKVEPEFCRNGWRYNLHSECLGLHSECHGPHNISRYNPQECFVLTHRKYTVTLKEWLKNTKDEKKWGPISQDWKLHRPTEETRQIIQGILRAVYELHTNESFHGFLCHLENFAIYDELVIGSDHKKIKRVFLIHANCKDQHLAAPNSELDQHLAAPNSELNQHLAAPNSAAIKKGKKKDMLAVLDVIFNQIIKYEDNSRFPKDLQKLRELLEQQDVSSHSWKLIVNHPSLWHWKSRFSYIEGVHNQFQHARRAKKPIWNSMRQEFNNIEGVRGWTQRIPSNTPLRNVFNYSKYSSTPEELLRYLRNLYVHYKDEWDGGKIYLREEVIELLATQVSELFLVDLYNIMCKLKIKI